MPLCPPTNNCFFLYSLRVALASIYRSLKYPSHYWTCLFCLQSFQKIALSHLESIWVFKVWNSSEVFFSTHSHTPCTWKLCFKKKCTSLVFLCAENRLLCFIQLQVVLSTLIFTKSTLLKKEKKIPPDFQKSTCTVTRLIYMQHNIC